MKKKISFTQISNGKTSSGSIKSTKINGSHDGNINSSLLNFSLGIEKYKANNEILAKQNKQQQNSEAILEKKIIIHKNSSYPISYNLLNYNEYDEVESSNYMKATANNSIINSSNKKLTSSTLMAKFLKCFNVKFKLICNEFNFSYLINIFLLLLIIYNYIQTYFLKNDLCELQRKLEEATAPLSSLTNTESNQKDYFYKIQKV